MSESNVFIPVITMHFSSPPLPQHSCTQTAEKKRGDNGGVLTLIWTFVKHFILSLCNSVINITVITI